MPPWARLWARDSALMLVSQALTVVATSVAAILVARSLDADDWGVFSALLGLSFALAMFVEFGLSTWLLRELSRIFVDGGDGADREARRLVDAALGGAVVVSAAVVALGTAGSLALGQSLDVVVALSLLLLYGALFATTSVLESHLRARRRLRRVVAASVLEKYLLLMLLVAVAVTSDSVWPIGAAYVAAGSIRISIVALGVLGRTLPARPRVRDVLWAWRKSLPFALSSGAITFIARLDVLFLVALSATAAGYFAIGERILGPAVALAVIGATTLYPFLARRLHGPRAIWRFALGFGVCGAVLAATGYVLAPTLVPLIFGDQYEAAVRPVQIMLLVLPLMYASNPLLTYAFSYGRERATVVATVVAAAAGTVAILAGQLAWDASGAAAGLVVREALLLVAFGSIAATANRMYAEEGRLPVSDTVHAPIG
jgi:O-antigen/teichoic acid export membrane protein